MMGGLAKQALDVGLFTNKRAHMLEFWQRGIGLPFAELLPLGGGLQQHRHSIGDSVLKVNHSREPLVPAPPSGLRRLNIGRADLTREVLLADPDGNEVVLAPTTEVEQIRIDLTVTHLNSHLDFYGGALGLPAADERTFRCGASQIRLLEGEATIDPPQLGPGYRYLTIQVFDVRRAHADILRRGGREGRPPQRLGDVAHISFVRDPDGNWIEISQRKSITGSLD
jgi:catechol 2,3-dioxygenase-like lactoylglutathione lyase family enzyme